MQRISTPTAVNGKFIDGDLSVGRKATQFSASWCNALQEELCSVLEKFGIALDPSRNDQIAGIFGKVLTGSKDDNPQYLGQKLEYIDGGVDASRIGDVAFREEDTRGGKVMAAFIRDKVIKASMLADGFKVEKSQIGSQAVDTDQLAGDSVGSQELKSGAVMARHMGFEDCRGEGSEYKLYNREGQAGEILLLYSSSGSVKVVTNPKLTIPSPGGGSYAQEPEVYVTANPYQLQMFVCTGRYDSSSAYADQKDMYKWLPVAGGYNATRS